MENDLAILAKMNASRVQPHAFQHSLQSLNQKSLALAVKEKKFNRGVGGPVSYWVSGAKKGDRSASLICHVAAKELVLLNQKVFCTSIPELVLHGNEDLLLDRMGVGYLVVSDVNANSTNCTPFQWDCVQAILLQHISRGGGLIVGSENLDEVRLGYDFIDALRIFESVKVV